MKLLYITFVDLDSLPKTGSAVRPAKMLHAFEELGVEIINVSGINNNISVRREAIKSIRKVLKSWTPDACYIEPPSGPMFYLGDLLLIKSLHRKGVPISIFYRDAYWKYPDFYITKDTKLPVRFKYKVVEFLQRWQWKVFENNIDMFYFPSLSMANEFDAHKKDALPPGCFVPENYLNNDLSCPLEFIFVGGASKNYGTFLTLDAFEKVNNNNIAANLTYICPKNQWDSLGLENVDSKAWLNVVHASGDKQLKEYYEKADVALLTAPRTFYRDFAMPIKVFEYISYLKPLLVTDCVETARVVRDNNIGWIVKDNIEEVADKIKYLCDNPNEVRQIKEKMEIARDNNLWIKRAEKVLNDFELIIEDKA